MPKLFIVDPAGARAASLATARDRYDEANKQVFGADLDPHEHTPQNQIAGINALLWTEVGEELVRAALYGASIDHAPGRFLDSLGSLLDIRRVAERHSRIVGTVTGTAGTVIPAGRIAKTTNGDRFKTETAVAIEPGGSTVSFIAIEPGAIPVGAGSLSQIVSTQTGWDSVTNEAAGAIGQPAETDAEFRAALHARTAHSSVGSMAALRSALSSAGAARFRVFENPAGTAATQGGVSIPSHSIFAVVSGGMDDDIERAIENHRGMGVGTLTAETGRQFVHADAQGITAGRMAFNGVNLPAFNLAGKSVEQIAETLSGLTGAPSYIPNDTGLLAFHSWRPGVTGHSDQGGSVAESGALLPEFKATSVFYEGSNILSAWTRAVGSTGPAASFSVSYTLSGVDTDHDMTGAAVSPIDNFLELRLATAIPAAATDVTVTLSPVRDLNNIVATQTAYAAVKVTSSAGAAPSHVRVFGNAKATGIAIIAHAYGTITKWQYQRFAGGADLDADWVDIPNSATPELETTISGFTAGTVGNRVRLRAVNGTESTAHEGLIFDTPTATAATIQSIIIDGGNVVVEFDQPLVSAFRSGADAAAQWTVTRNQGGAISVGNFRVIGNAAYLILDHYIAPGATFTASYNAIDNSARIAASNGVAIAASSATQASNQTRAGVPARPMPILLFETQSGYNIHWQSNSVDGGQAVDRYEYQTSADNGVTWSEWRITSALSTFLSMNTPTPPARVRVRGSAPDVRAATILGLTGLPGPAPFLRPVGVPVTITVTLDAGSSLTGNDLDKIRQSLVAHIESYDIGESIWANDIEARVETQPGVRVSNLTIQSGGIDISGVSQKAYNKWTLTVADVTIQFS